MRIFKSAAGMFFLVSFFTGAIADTINVSGNVGNNNIATGGSTIVNGGQVTIDNSKKMDIKVDNSKKMDIKVDNSKKMDIKVDNSKKIDNSRNITNNGSMTVNGNITNK